MSDQSSWRRLAYTPLRDWTRGRLTARLDLKTLIAQSQLPAELKTIVYKTTRRARLWRGERIDAAQELINHFADGLATGQHPNQLRESFGDWKVAARLIGRSKRRARPLELRVAGLIIKAATIAMLLFVLLTGVAVTRFLLARPIGNSSFTDSLNAKASSVPEADRAWPLYEKAWQQLIAAEPNETVRWPMLGVNGHRTSPEMPSFQSFLDHNPDMLKLIRQASMKPHLGYFDAAPEYLLESAMVLRGDALVAAAEGKGGQVRDDFTAMLAVSNHFAECFPGFLGMSLQQRFETLQAALKLIGNILAENPQAFSDEQLRELSQVVAGLSDQQLAIDFSMMQKLWEETITHQYGGDGFLCNRGIVKRQSPSIDGLTESKRWANRAIGTAMDAIIALIAIPFNTLKEYGDRFFADLQAYQNTPLWERTTWSPADLLSHPATREETVHRYQHPWNLALAQLSWPLKFGFS